MWFSTGSDEIELLLPPQPLTRLPGRGRSSGLFKHAGLLIDVLDLRRCLDFESKVIAPTERFIVVKAGEGAFAFHVDEVANIVDKDSGHWGDVPIYVPPQVFSATFQYKGRLYLHASLLALRELEPGAWRELGARLLAAGEALALAAMPDESHGAQPAGPARTSSSKPSETAPAGKDEPRTNSRTVASPPSKPKADSRAAASQAAQSKTHNGAAASRPPTSRGHGGTPAPHPSKSEVNKGAAMPRPPESKVDNATAASRALKTGAKAGGDAVSTRSSATRPGRPSIPGDTLHTRPRPAGDGKQRGGRAEPPLGASGALSATTPGRPAVRAPASQATAPPATGPAVNAGQAKPQAPSKYSGARPGPPVGQPRRRDTESAVEAAPDKEQRAWGGWALLIALLCLPALLYGVWRYGDADRPREAVQSGAGAVSASRDEPDRAAQAAVEEVEDAKQTMASREALDAPFSAPAEAFPQSEGVEVESDAVPSILDGTSMAEPDEAVGGPRASAGTDLSREPVAPSQSEADVDIAAEETDVGLADPPVDNVRIRPPDRHSADDAREGSAHVSRQGRVVTIEIDAPAPREVLTQEGASVAVEVETPTRDAVADEAGDPPETGLDDVAPDQDTEAVSVADAADTMAEPQPSEPPEAVSVESQGEADAVSVPQTSGRVEAASDFVSEAEPEAVVSIEDESDGVAASQAIGRVEAASDSVSATEPEPAVSIEDESDGVAASRATGIVEADSDSVSATEPEPADSIEDESDGVAASRATGIVEADSNPAGRPESQETVAVADEYANEAVVSVQKSLESVSENAHSRSAGETQERLIVHIVVKGDTLWDIAQRYINDPFRYPELARLSRIKNPHLIYPGDKVRILLRAPRNGQAQE